MPPSVGFGAQRAYGNWPQVPAQNFPGAYPPYRNPIYGSGAQHPPAMPGHMAPWQAQAHARAQAQAQMHAHNVMQHQMQNQSRFGASGGSTSSRELQNNHFSSPDVSPKAGVVQGKGGSAQHSEGQKKSDAMLDALAELLKKQSDMEARLRDVDTVLHSSRRPPSGRQRPSLVREGSRWESDAPRSPNNFANHAPNSPSNFLHRRDMPASRGHTSNRMFHAPERAEPAHYRSSKIPPQLESAERERRSDVPKSTFNEDGETRATSAEVKHVLGQMRLLTPLAEAETDLNNSLPRWDAPHVVGDKAEKRRQRGKEKGGKPSSGKPGSGKEKDGTPSSASQPPAPRESNLKGVRRLKAAFYAVLFANHIEFVGARNLELLAARMREQFEEAYMVQVRNCGAWLSRTLNFSIRGMVEDGHKQILLDLPPKLNSAGYPVSDGKGLNSVKRLQIRVKAVFDLLLEETVPAPLQNFLQRLATGPGSTLHLPIADIEKDREAYLTDTESLILGANERGGVRILPESKEHELLVIGFVVLRVLLGDLFSGHAESMRRESSSRAKFARRNLQAVATIIFEAVRVQYASIEDPSDIPGLEAAVGNRDVINGETMKRCTAEVCEETATLVQRLARHLIGASSVQNADKEDGINQFVDASLRYQQRMASLNSQKDAALPSAQASPRSDAQSAPLPPPAEGT